MKTRTKTNFLLTVGIWLMCVSVCMGCSKNESPDTSGDPLTISLHAGLRVSSKSPIKDGVEFMAAVAGWQSVSPVDYGQRRTWQTYSMITASSAASVVILNEAQYYSQNGSVRTYIKAWYPEGSLSDDGRVTFEGSPDGTLDVLLSQDVSGSALDASGKTLVFDHPLTQLKFAVQGDALFGNTTTVRSITIKGAALPTGIELTTNSVSYTTLDLTVPGIDGTQVITTENKVVGFPTMISPIQGNRFTIDVQTSDVTYRDVVVTVDDQNIKAGKAYTITLSFAGFEITAQASVTPWDESGTGGGDVTTE